MPGPRRPRPNARRRGFDYLTEECVALRADGTCHGLARALHVEDARIVPPSGFASERYVIVRSDGEHHTRLFQPPQDRVWRGAARVAAIVAIDHAPDAADTLSPLSSGAAIAALWPLVFRPDATALAELPPALHNVARYRMITSRPEIAFARAISLAEELGLDV